MGSIRDQRERIGGYGGPKPWLARHRDDAGKEHTKGFRTKREAEAWLAEQAVARARGEWIDPREGKVTFEAFAEEWRSVQVHRGTTAAQVESHFRNHVYPAIGSKPLAAIRPSHVQAMVKTLSVTLAPATVETIYRHVSAAMKAAARDRLIPRSPCDGIRLPKADRDVQVVPLELRQIEAVADAMPERWQAAVWLAVGTGMRQGEVLGLTVDRIDFLRRTVTVDRQMVTVSNQEPAFGPPKSKASFRTIPLPESVGFVLSEHLRRFPAGPDGLLFTTSTGEPVRRQRIGGAWRQAADGAGLLGVGFHATRHFYASALIQSGASVKVVQARLGHASAVETLDTYGHLWPDSEDETRAAINALFDQLQNPADLTRTGEPEEG